MGIPKDITEAMDSYPLFYQKVWKACANIPEGEVRTYKWIASKIRRPKAHRAVGIALKMNPFAPIIPCHRVVKSGGFLGGYSAPGGPQTKWKLLKQEGVALQGKKAILS